MVPCTVPKEVLSFQTFMLRDMLVTKHIIKRGEVKQFKNYKEIITYSFLMYFYQSMNKSNFEESIYPFNNFYLSIFFTGYYYFLKTCEVSIV